MADFNPAVIAACEALADELLVSPEYLALTDAQDRVQHDEDALRAVLNYRTTYEAMTNAFSTQEEDPDGFRAAAMAYRDAEEEMQGNVLVREMMSAQQTFSALLDEVNTILQNAVSGGSSGCSGNCATCGGCH